MITKFTILGERCSGTNYLEELMKNNFYIDVTWNYGWKHYFGSYKFKNTEDEDETLFIGIVRDPIHWLSSFFKKQYHINKPSEQSKDIHNFLFGEFNSYHHNGTIVNSDLNPLTNKKYKNIFEMRFIKNYYLINKMPNNVKNYILINYEKLRDDTVNILSTIENKFGLIKKNPIYKNIKYYKKSKNTLYKKSHKNEEISFPIKYQLLCLMNLNKIQEAKLGYNIYINQTKTKI
jgi:hypothetical protein